MTTPEQVMGKQDEITDRARKALERLVVHTAMEDCQVALECEASVLAALSPLPPPGWRLIENAPRRANADDPMEPLLIAWTNSDGAHVVGEAYWHPEDPTGGGWWWAGTSPGDYYSDCVEQSITGRITHWMPLPQPPAKGEG